jgi:hypothetical protein
MNPLIWFWPSILLIIQFFNKFHFACYWIFTVKNQLITSTHYHLGIPNTMLSPAIEETSHLEQEYVETFPCEYVDAQCIADGFVWIVSYTSTIQSIVVWKMHQLEDHQA